MHSLKLFAALPIKVTALSLALVGFASTSEAEVYEMSPGLCFDINVSLGHDHPELCRERCTGSYRRNGQFEVPRSIELKYEVWAAYRNYRNAEGMDDLACLLSGGDCFQSSDHSFNAAGVQCLG